MASDAPRYVENDVAPPGSDGEVLSESEREEIRARCAREVERGVHEILETPPKPQGRFRLGQELYAGPLGLAFGLLHLHERTGEARLLEQAGRYLDVGLESLERSGVPRPEEWLSFHGSGGVSAVAAVVKHRLGDRPARDRHLESYRRVALRAAEPFPTEDLLWGRGGFLFGAAFLRRQLGEDSVPDELVRGALERMLEVGRGHARVHAPELTPGPKGIPPLLYMNLNGFMFECFARSLVGSRSGPARWLAGLGARVFTWSAERQEHLSHRYDIGLVHGLSGNLYLMLHFPDLVERLGAMGEVRASLDCLVHCIDSERGMLELLPSRHSPPGVFTDKVHWCNGTTGAVFLFARAYEVLGDVAYLEAARRAAGHVWRYGLLRKGNGICHGVAGNGYAFLSLHRTTGEEAQLDRALHFARACWSDRVAREQSPPDHPWSLYEGRMGTLCFHLDCCDPARARFPAFEV